MTRNPEKRGRIFLAIVCGAALTCAFDTIAIGFLAWFALVFLLLAIRNATAGEAFYLGLLAGLVHFGTLLYWLVPTMHLYGQLPVWLSIGALFLLAFYLALYAGLFAAAVAAAAKRPVSLVLLVPVFWVALEYVKTFLFSGFPWGLLGYSQYRYLYLIQSADIFGVYGVSFFVCMVNAAVFVILLHAGGLSWQNRPAGRPAAVFCAGWIVLIFALNAGYAGYRIPAVDEKIAGADRLRVAVVQGNIDQSVKWDEEYVSATVEQYIRLSEKAMDFSPALVVWPETAMPFYFAQEDPHTQKVMEAIRRMETWFLLGSPSFEYNPETEALRLYNSAFLVTPQARVAGVYDKAHLVPFGEYVPFSGLFPFLGRMVHGVSDFTPGREGKVLSVADTDAGVQVCYEIIFPHLSAKMVENGADLIVNITNDAWFGDTAGPYQHYSMAVLRSVENRRALVRSANTGISGFVDPAGRMTGRTGLFEAAVASENIAVIKDPPTLYTRYRDVLPAACIVLFMLVGAAAGIRSKRRIQKGK